MLATDVKERAEHLRRALSNEAPRRTPSRSSFPCGAPRCRIYQPSHPVVQSGGRTRRKWLLEFEPASPRWIDPLMGWTGSDDAFASVRLRFATRSAVVEYAERHGLDYEVIDPPARRMSMPHRMGPEPEDAHASLCALPNPWLELAIPTRHAMEM